jgi:hypothetical protein
MVMTTATSTTQNVHERKDETNVYGRVAAHEHNMKRYTIRTYVYKYDVYYKKGIVFSPKYGILLNRTPYTWRLRGK